MTDEHYMRLAIEQALIAESKDEVPVGAVVVVNDEVIAQGHNQSITFNDPTAHAEVVALRKAGEVVQNYRLIEATLYVTLEPCAMCVGAMHHARIKRLVTGARDPKTGCAHSVLSLLNEKCFFHQIQLETDILSEECATILKSFFSKRR